MTKKQSVRDRAMLAALPVTVAPVDAGKTDSPKTAPGAFLGFMQKESEVARENDSLRKELSAWDGALPARQLDPACVVHSKWANRLEESFGTDEFRRLKQEIEDAGRNVQPIKVRPLPGSAPQQYEIVFGHRRHRACLELGIPVWAIIESLDDVTTYVEMERENRLRANLSPFEQGQMYLRGVALFGGMRKLSERIHRDVSDISKAVSLANLPPSVLSAFASPNDLQFRWAKPLSDAYASAPQALQDKAMAIVQRRRAGTQFTGQEVFSELVGASGGSVTRGGVFQEISVNSRVVARVAEKRGRVVVEFEKGVISSSQLEAVSTAVRSIFS